MLPYTCGIRRLDKIYLDTTFVADHAAHPTFPSKSQGLEELLRELQKYPHDTVFHLNAWTLGYEDVWLALSSALDTQVSNSLLSCEWKII